MKSRQQSGKAAIGSLLEQFVASPAADSGSSFGIFWAPALKIAGE
jgi:hypothetical protein